MPPRTPRWDADNHTLWLDREIIIEFKQPAKLEEPVLAAFEAADWRHRVPNPHVGGHRAKKSAYNACSLLNARQSALTFRTCNSGRDISWEWRKA